MEKQESFKLQFNGELVSYVPFSPWREKGTERAPLKGVTHGASLKKPTT